MLAYVGLTQKLGVVPCPLQFWIMFCHSRSNGMGVARRVQNWGAEGPPLGLGECRSLRNTYVMEPKSRTELTLAY